MVTYYTVFVIELYSWRVYAGGSTPHPDEALVLQTTRHLTNDIDGVLSSGRVLVCEGERKWRSAVLQFTSRYGN